MELSAILPLVLILVKNSMKVYVRNGGVFGSL